MHIRSCPEHFGFQVGVRSRAWGGVGQEVSGVLHFLSLVLIDVECIVYAIFGADFQMGNDLEFRNGKVA